MFNKKYYSQRLASEFLAIYPPEDCIYHVQGWLDWRYTIARFQQQRWKLNVDGKIGSEIRFSINYTEPVRHGSISYTEAERYGSIVRDVAHGIIKRQDETSSLIKLEPELSDRSTTWMFLPWYSPPHYRWLVENITGILNNPKLGGVHGYHPVPLHGKPAEKAKKR